MNELISRAREGDSAAFTELMELHMQTLYKTAYTILRNDEDAADAVADTILTCWEKLWQLKDDHCFKSWMVRILINQCNRILKTHSHFSSDSELPEIPYQESHYRDIEWKEILESLSPKYRLILVLYYVEQFNTREIAEILRLPHATIRTRLARGREQLRKMYEHPEPRRVTP